MANSGVTKVFVFILTLGMLLIILASFSVLVYNIITYTMPTYRVATLDTIENGTTVTQQQVLVYTDEYLGKVNTISFLQVFALLIIAASIFYAGLLFFLKSNNEPQRKLPEMPTLRKM